jgi:hypothetical protein
VVVVVVIAADEVAVAVVVVVVIAAAVVAVVDTNQIIERTVNLATLASIIVTAVAVAEVAQ